MDRQIKRERIYYKFERRLYHIVNPKNNKNKKNK